MILFKWFLFFLVLILQNFSTWSQDVHFTMFHSVPTVLNPGAAGVFNGTFRTSVNHRSQWASVTNRPYNTYSYNIDVALMKRKPGNGYIGMGLTAYHDVAGVSNFGTTKVDLTFSGILRTDDYNTLSLGISGGWGQQSISTNNLKWDAQYDGLAYNASLLSGENFDFQKKQFFDLSSGVLWSYGTGASNIASYDKFNSTLGIAYHHALRPRIKTNIGELERLYSRIVLYGDLHFAQMYSKVSFIPRFSAFFQGPSREINIGFMTRYLIKDGSKYTGNLKGFALSLGAYYRILDALSPSVELEIAGFTIGYSYDLNLSQLRTASQFMGGSEIFIRFQNPNPFSQFSSRPRLR